MSAQEQAGFSIRVTDLGKCYSIYEKPAHRLQQFILPRLDRLRGRVPKAYHKEFWALRDLSFTVARGEVVGIVGRNGSGKSTLLQMICGTLAPTTGSVEVQGRVAALLELGSGFNPDFTGRENVYMNGVVLGLSEQEIAERYDDIAAFADIGDFIEQPVKTYSSGMMMRLAFAVSVCIDPDILVIDEALAVGDAAFQFKCMERMKRLTASGTTLLFVSHDMGMVKGFCHRVLYLEQGREKMQGPPDAVAEQYFMDIRDEQRRHATGGMPVFRKKTLGDSDLLAFGTEEGRIVSACFLPDEGMKAVVGHRERISIRIDVEYDRALAGPALSVVVLDRRMLDLAGKFFHLRPDTEQDGKFFATIAVEFEALFRPGTYFVTLRLESRGMGGNFMAVDKQPAALSFEVAPFEPDFLGTVDVGISQVLVQPKARETAPWPRRRVVALLAIRNEERYLARCLEHLHQQGVETCLIDNDSTDGSLDIARRFLDRGVFRIERLPYKGHFDLVEQLRLKEALAAEIDADWFIHLDADEILEAPRAGVTLREAFEEVDRLGYNVVNFDEFVFVPAEGDPSSEGTDYVDTMRRYYFFSPSQQRLQRAWKKASGSLDLVEYAGHHVNFENKSIYPENFVLRHYIVLSQTHLERKYGLERKYSMQEVTERKWHGKRACFDPARARLPSPEALKVLGNGGWDRSDPHSEHLFFGE